METLSRQTVDQSHSSGPF